MTHQGARDGSGLITGDAVVVELRLAKLPSRSLAFLIDLTLQLIALAILTFLLGAAADLADPTLAYVLFFVGTIAVLVGYPVAMESLTRGRTVGKLAIGLRAVRDDGGSIRFRHALARGLAAVVEIYACFGAIAVVVSLLSPEGKRVGDYLGGTVVVRERAPRQAVAPLWIPPGLQSWATTLDLARLRPETALTARQFVVRAASLKGQARQTLGRSIADEVARQVSPPPPSGISPELYLSVVLAERRRRTGGSDTGPPAAAAPQRPDANPPPTHAPAGDTAPDHTGDGFTAPQ
jgi:uncharacterized RDD family membrane protein YckC